MRPLLFYPNYAEYQKDTTHHTFLENEFDVKIDIYNVWEHENAYGHEEIPEYFPDTDIKMPDTCWCDIPDKDKEWPQLFLNPERADTWTGKPKFIAAGKDIFNINANDVYTQYGTNISGPGPWEV
jgi:hypothetical protein